MNSWEREREAGGVKYSSKKELKLVQTDELNNVVK
jgi:hypothetical protein